MGREDVIDFEDGLLIDYGKNMKLDLYVEKFSLILTSLL